MGLKYPLGRRRGALVTAQWRIGDAWTRTPLSRWGLMVSFLAMTMACANSAPFQGGASPIPMLPSSVSCGCGICAPTSLSPPSYTDRIAGALRRVEVTDHDMRAVPRAYRCEARRTEARTHIVALADKARQYTVITQRVDVLEPAVSAVETAVCQYALWPIRASMMADPPAASQHELTWGVQVISPFAKVTPFMLPTYAPPQVTMAGHAGECVSAQLLILPFHDAVTIRTHEGDEHSGILVTPLQSNTGAVIPPEAWTISSVQGGQSTATVSPMNFTSFSDVLRPLQESVLTVAPGTVGALRCRLHLPDTTPSGTYHAQIVLHPDGQTSCTIPVTVSVWHSKLRAPDTFGAEMVVPATVTTPATILDSLCGRYGLIPVTEQASQRNDWMTITEAEVSPAQSLVTLRLLPWRAWARRTMGVRLPRLVHATTEMAYASVRLDAVADGIEDVRFLQHLAAVSASLPKSQRRAAEAILADARKLAASPTRADATSRLLTIRQRMADLFEQVEVADGGQHGR